jgi:hypothetical protein
MLRPNNFFPFPAWRGLSEAVSIRSPNLALGWSIRRHLTQSVLLGYRCFVEAPLKRPRLRNHEIWN